jgi:hypothetical protein
MMVGIDNLLGGNARRKLIGTRHMLVIVVPGKAL